MVAQWLLMGGGLGRSHGLGPGGLVAHQRDSKKGERCNRQGRCNENVAPLLPRPKAVTEVPAILHVPITAKSLAANQGTIGRATEQLIVCAAQDPDGWIK